MRSLLLLLLCSCSVGIESVDETSEKAIYDNAGNLLPIDAATVNGDKVAWEPVDKKSAAPYAGVGDFGPGCTGTFVDVGGGDDAPAYVLTNGHCVNGGIPAGTTLLDSDRTGGASIEFDKYRGWSDYPAEGSASEVRIAYTTRLEYATQTGADVALFRLGGELEILDFGGNGSKPEPVTVGALKRRGITPIKIARTPVQTGEAIENVGLPRSKGDALINPSDWYLRRSRCAAGASVAELQETSSAWSGSGPTFQDTKTFAGSRRHRCSVLGGSSGSPMLRRGKAGLEIVGVHFTSVYVPDLVKANVSIGCNAKEGDRCVEPIVSSCPNNGPCEVAGGKKIVHIKENYFSPVHTFAGCFTSGRFDLKKPGCALPR